MDYISFYLLLVGSLLVEMWIQWHLCLFLLEVLRVELHVYPFLRQNHILTLEFLSNDLDPAKGVDNNIYSRKLHVSSSVLIVLSYK